MIWDPHEIKINTSIFIIKIDSINVMGNIETLSRC